MALVGSLMADGSYLLSGSEPPYESATSGFNYVTRIGATEARLGVP